MTDHDCGAEELGTLLRNRVRDFHPDLAALTTSAIRAGGRIKHRRRLTVASTTLGGVAAAAVLAVQLAPTPSPSPGGFATAPSPHPSTPAGPSQCLPPLQAQTQAQMQAQARNLAARKGALTKMTGPLRMPKASRQTPSPCPTQPAVPQPLPVTFNAPGWTCDTPGDGKFTCSDGASTVLVTVRPAKFHGDYLNNPDKAGPNQFVSDIHDGSFATIGLVGGNASLDQLAEYLRWN
jgi:hypothetical protein